MSQPTPSALSHVEAICSSYGALVLDWLLLL